MGFPGTEFEERGQNLFCQHPQEDADPQLMSALSRCFPRGWLLEEQHPSPSLGQLLRRNPQGAGSRGALGGQQ